MRPAVLGLVAAAGVIGTVFLAGPSLSRKAMARRCMENMKSIGYAAGRWASDHDSLTPTNWVAFSAELVNPRMMLCPSDPERKPASDWTTFGLDNSSYEIVGAGARWGDFKRPFFRCKAHGFVCCADGAVTPHDLAHKAAFTADPSGETTGK